MFHAEAQQQKSLKMADVFILKMGQMFLLH